MASKGKKWLIGCGAGCGGSIVLLILITVGSGLMMMRPMNGAVDAQRTLDERYGRRDAYTPPVEGITADRLERFLAVRAAVMPLCAKFSETAESFAAMEALDSQEAEPSKGELFSALGKVMGGVFGIVGELGEYTRLRNETLLAQEMSLGEYVWIYTLVYHSWLGYPTNVSFDEAEGDELTTEETSTLHGLVRRHADALAEAGRTEEAEVWRAEARRLQREGAGVPFAGGALPPDILAVFAPREEIVRELHCAPMTAFEMSQVEKHGLSIKAD